MPVALVVVSSASEKRQWLRPDKPSPYYELVNDEVTDLLGKPEDMVVCIHGVTGAGKTSAVRRSVSSPAFDTVHVVTMTELLGVYPLAIENVAFLKSGGSPLKCGDLDPLSISTVVFDGIDSMNGVVVSVVDEQLCKVKGISKPFGGANAILTGNFGFCPDLAVDLLGPGHDFVGVDCLKGRGVAVKHIELPRFVSHPHKFPPPPRSVTLSGTGMGLVEWALTRGRCTVRWQA